MPTKQRITNVVFLYIPVLRVGVLPVIHCKGSGSYSLVCPRPCSSTCRWARCATHRQKCSYAHFGRVSAAPFRRNFAVPKASTGNRIGHLYSATASWRFFNSCVARVLATALHPRIFVLPRQTHFKMFNMSFVTYKKGNK